MPLTPYFKPDSWRMTATGHKVQETALKQRKYINLKVMGTTTRTVQEIRSLQDLVKRSITVAGS